MLRGPRTSKLKSRTRFSATQAHKYPHVSEYYLYYLVYRESSSCLFPTFVSSNIKQYTEKTSGAKWHCRSRQASRYLSFRANRAETECFVGLSHYMMLHLCQQHKLRRHTIYEGTRIRSLMYLHGG